MVRRDGGHIRTREDISFCLPNPLWSVTSLILGLGNLKDGGGGKSEMVREDVIRDISRM